MKKLVDVVNEDGSVTQEYVIIPNEGHNDERILFDTINKFYSGKINYAVRFDLADNYRKKSSPFEGDFRWPLGKRFAEINEARVASGDSKAKGFYAVPIEEVRLYEFYTASMINSLENGNIVNVTLLDYDEGDVIFQKTEERFIDDTEITGLRSYNRAEVCLKRANIVLEAELQDFILQKSIIDNAMRKYEKRKTLIVQLAIDKKDSYIHGLYHWEAVERYGEHLCNMTAGADRDVIRWFAYLHDCKRQKDGSDIHHGERAAEYIDSIRSEYLSDMNDEQIEKLKKACRLHTTTKETGDPTIDVCFDADRLDLRRLGIEADPDKMASRAGKLFAKLRREV